LKTPEQIALEVLENFDCCAYHSRSDMLLDFLAKVDEERAKAEPAAWINIDNLMLNETAYASTTKYNDNQVGVYLHPISKAQLKRLVTQMFGAGYQIIPPGPTTPHVTELEEFAKEQHKRLFNCI